MADLDYRLNRISCFIRLALNQEIGDVSIPVQDALGFVQEDLLAISREWTYTDVATDQLSGMVDDLTNDVLYYKGIASDLNRRIDELQVKANRDGREIDRLDCYVDQLRADNERLEAKVKAMQAKLPQPPLNREGLTQEELECIRRNEKIAAIKSHRARTLMGLVESKNFIESCMDVYGDTIPQFVEAK